MENDEPSGNGGSRVSYCYPLHNRDSLMGCCGSLGVCSAERDLCFPDIYVCSSASPSQEELARDARRCRPRRRS